MREHYIKMKERLEESRWHIHQNYDAKPVTKQNNLPTMCNVQYLDHHNEKTTQVTCQFQCAESPTKASNRTGLFVS